jgi:AraC-like DNA-binding protein/quercetin dioxygenase-like cupin family protein
MSETSYRAAMTTLVFQPDLWRLWQLATAVAARPGRVQVLRGREAPQGTVREMHLHHVPTLVACLSGVLRIATAGRSVDLGPGEFLVIAPAAWHAHVPLRPGSSGIGVGLTPGGRSDVVLHDADGWHGFTVPDGRMRPLLHRLLTATAAERGELATQVLTEAIEQRGEHREMPAPVGRMALTLWWQLTGPISARHILAASGLSPRQAHRLFVEQFGTTPQQALRQCRLDLARSLLSEGCAPSEAAVRSGFRTRADLTRAQRLSR